MNTTPSSAAPVIAQAGKNIKGLIELGPTLKITQITPEEMNARLAVLVQADADYNTGRSLLKAAYDVFHPAEIAVKDWLFTARKVLTKFFGNRWSPQWVQAGFILPTTAIPDIIDDRLALALRLSAFLSANTQYEVAGLEITGAIGKTLQEAAVAAEGIVTNASTVVKQQLTDRSAAVDAMTTSMRLLVKILSEVLTPDDPRWLKFGLNIPASLATPRQPQGMQLAPNPTMVGKGVAGTAEILATCAAQPLTTRYRWRLRIVGLETAYRLVASTTEPMAMITDLPAGMTVEVMVQAVNGDRQGVPSAPVIYPPMAEVPAAVPPTEPKVELAPATNGHSSNGHATATNGVSLTRR